MKRFWALLALLMLAACGDEQPILKLVPAAGPVIPDSLLTCPSSPEVPDDTASQSDVGRYLIDLYTAGADCRSNLGAVRKLLKPVAPPDAVR